MTKQEFAKFIWGLSKAIPKFAPNFNDSATLDVWYDQFSKLDLSTLAQIYKKAIVECDEFPSIRKLFSMAGKAPLDDEDVGRDVGERIWAALERFKSTKFDLKKELGEIGEAVVKMQGGWKAICETATYANAAMLKAQWRELATVLIRKARTGSIDSRPAFESLPPSVGKLLESSNIIDMTRGK